MDKDIAYEKFYDKTFNLETYNGRILQPKDLDIYCKFDEYPKIIEILNKYFTVELFKRQKTPYFMTSNEEQNKYLTHYRYRCKLLNVGLHKRHSALYHILKLLIGQTFITKLVYCTTIDIDIIVLNDEAQHNTRFITKHKLFPPFGKPDFRCNLLYMTQNTSFDSFGLDCNIQINTMVDYIVNTLTRTDTYTEISRNFICDAFANSQMYDKCRSLVFDDIINHRAVILSSKVPIFRIYKMLNKDYNIDSSTYLKTLKNFIYNSDDTIDQVSITITKHIYKTEDDNSDSNTDTDTGPNIATHTEDPSDVCIICHDNFLTSKYQIHYGCHCKAVYHLKCFTSFIKSQITIDDYSGYIICPMCRSKSSCLCEAANIIAITNHKCYNDPKCVGARKCIYNPIKCTSFNCENHLQTNF
jgi:hypothetical protein